jgi:hypothetical protein
VVLAVVVAVGVVVRGRRIRPVLVSTPSGPHGVADDPLHLSRLRLRDGRSRRGGRAQGHIRRVRPVNADPVCVAIVEPVRPAEVQRPVHAPCGLTEIRRSGHRGRSSYERTHSKPRPKR